MCGIRPILRLGIDVGACVGVSVDAGVDAGIGAGVDVGLGFVNGNNGDRFLLALLTGSCLSSSSSLMILSASTRLNDFWFFLE